jgi:hypothetical protein
VEHSLGTGTQWKRYDLASVPDQSLKLLQEGDMDIFFESVRVNPMASLCGVVHTR